MSLPSIKDCESGNCTFHFPQFDKLDVEDSRACLERAIERNYSNDDTKIDKFRKAITLIDLKTMPTLLEACELAGEAYGYEFYLDLRGWPAIYRPCCR